MPSNHECHCRICEPDERNASPRRQEIARRVGDFGWHVAAVRAEDGVPGWVYSIGLWHSFGADEVCVFGLPLNASMRIISIAGEVLRSGGDLTLGQWPEVAIREVDISWYEDLFAHAVDFYQDRLPVFRQLVWPERPGRASQPMLWLPWPDHPPGLWTGLRDDAGQGFPDRMGVFTTQRIASGEAGVAGVVHNVEGDWQFLEDGQFSPDNADGALVRLKRIIEGHPEVVEVLDLLSGEQAWRQPDGTWQRSLHFS